MILVALVGDWNSPYSTRILENQEPHIRPLLCCHSITHVQPTTPNSSDAARLEKDNTTDCYGSSIFHSAAS